MNQKQLNVIDKVQKLLALANSSNEHEAQTAAMRAQALLIKYNLTSADVEIEAGEEKYIRQDVATEFSRNPPEWKYVSSILIKFYYVRIVQTGEYLRDQHGFVRSTSGLSYKQIMKYAFVGQAHNITIALHVKDFLIRSFKELFKIYQSTTGCGANARSSYYMGLYQGLRTQLETTVSQVEKEMGLVVVPDAGLDQALKKLFHGMPLSTSRSRSSVNDYDAMAAGADDGANLRIARGLDSAAKSTAHGGPLKIGGR